MLSSDQRAIDGLLFARRSRTSAARREFDHDGPSAQALTGQAAREKRGRPMGAA